MADQETRAGARYGHGEVLRWVEQVHAPHDAALERAHQSPDVQDMPAIAVGASEGRTLALLLRMARARIVVEIGALAGYSAIWMARALPEDGKIHSIESDPRHAQVAKGNIAAAGLADRVEVHAGLALDVLATLEPEGPFDAVFIDADKGSYDQYGRWAAHHVRPGGLLLGDNAFYFGRLLDSSEDAAAMRRFHEEARDSFDTVCLPTPDGLLLGVRRS